MFVLTMQLHHFGSRILVTRRTWNTPHRSLVKIHCLQLLKELSPSLSCLSSAPLCISARSVCSVFAFSNEVERTTLFPNELNLAHEIRGDLSHLWCVHFFNTYSYVCPSLGGASSYPEDLAPSSCISAPISVRLLMCALRYLTRQLICSRRSRGTNGARTPIDP